MLDLTSEMIAPHLGPIVQGGQVEDVQINLQETTFPEIAVQEEPINQSAQQTLPSKHPSQKKLPKAARSVQALKTDSKAAQTEVGPRRCSTAKKLKCDIEGTTCDILPTLARLGVTLST